MHIMKSASIFFQFQQNRSRFYLLSMFNISNGSSRKKHLSQEIKCDALSLNMLDQP